MAGFTDLEQFRQTYFDECAEMLAIVEAGLLDLARGGADAETVNAVFRGVHSIKGGGGTFGLSALVAFAHEFETVLDEVRAGRLAPTGALVDLLIRANDVLGALLADAREGREGDGILAARVAADLRAVLGPAEADGAAVETTPTAAADGPQRFQIRFAPHPHMLSRGNEPLYLFRALAHFGPLEVECDHDAVPTLDHLDPESIHLSWTLRLETGQPEADVREIFDFVAEDCDLHVAVETEAEPEPAAGPPPDIGREVALVGPGGAMAEPLSPGLPAEPAPPRPAAGENGGRGALAGQSIRVDLDKLDRLVNLVGEMVITQAMVAEQAASLPPGQAPRLLEGLEELARHTRELQESVMAVRAQPVRSVFARMPRLVRELSTTLGKEVGLVMRGEETEVDKTVVENLADPLTHMIRNSMDHGIEAPDAREAAGKARAGTVTLSAQHRSGRIVIEVSDDGRGIDRGRVLRKAVDKGLVPADAQLSEEEVDQLIFLPGFSTAEAISNVSGRGVGMDVVRRNITQLGGRITVHNTPGEGTRFVLSLPLTLAVMDGMVIRTGGERFVLPLTNIVETLRPRPGDLHRVPGQGTVMMARGEYVQLAPLARLLGIQGAQPDPTRALVVLLETEEGGRFGLVVDELLGQQQVVVKSLDAHYRRLDGIAAATILGDGRVALILDVAGLQAMGRGLARTAAAEEFAHA